MNNLWPIVLQGWRPAVEILILAAGIYSGFLFIRGTRGAPVVTGFLALLLTLTIVTRVLDLKVLNVLLGQFFAVLATAVVVLFQPELRRILAEFGNLPLFNADREQRENIEDVVKAADRMSTARFGALIAIERNQSLSELAEGGVAINCELTPEMLETIFFPNNAVHDGGVIVRDGRILRAACIFPLTQRQDLPKSVGTRHRAAIGLTEESDAIVVVISEETGAISYAHKGQLVRGVTVEELRAFLSAALVRREPRPSRWARLRGFLARRRAAVSAVTERARP